MTTIMEVEGTYRWDVSWEVFLTAVGLLQGQEVSVSVTAESGQRDLIEVDGEFSGGGFYSMEKLKAEFSIGNKATLLITAEDRICIEGDDEVTTLRIYMDAAGIEIEIKREHPEPSFWGSAE